MTRVSHSSSPKSLKNGFTLPELILVMTLIAMLSSIAIGSLLRTNASFQFNAAAQAVNAMVREARSFAVTGKAQIDYSDYDGDGCRASAGDPTYFHTNGSCPPGPDYVTPANYGAHFNTATNTLTIFADLHDSTVVGAYDEPPAGLMVYTPGLDMRIAEYTLPDVYQFYIAGGTFFTNTVLFSPIFADVSFSPLLAPVTTNYFFVFGVEEKSKLRKSCMVIQRVAGIPEESTKVPGIVCGT